MTFQIPFQLLLPLRTRRYRVAVLTVLLVVTCSVSVRGQSGDQVRLRLVDGTYLRVDDAWESPQGIWYRQGSMSHLADKSRVKAIERGEPIATPTPKTAKKEAEEPLRMRPVVAEAPPPPPANQSGVYDKPAWIYLKGGARVEADSATESTAGVWYQRGSMSIFIDRSRIDRIELEEMEKVAQSDSSAKKERGWSTGRAALDNLIKQNGRKHGVDPYLIFLVMEQESHFNAHAVSPKGARGLMQLMPGTAARFGVRNSHDPAQNISGGTRYLRQLLSRFDNRVDLVLASYNAGEGAVMKFGHRVPPYKETKNYVKKISYKYRRSLAGTRTEAGSTQEQRAGAGDR
jgi:soluble lytic murein transglycosylase-like protein